jgi:hypothetical protein
MTTPTQRHRAWKPSLGEVLLGLAGAMAATTLITASVAAVTVRAENKRAGTQPTV